MRFISIQNDTAIIFSTDDGTQLQLLDDFFIKYSRWCLSNCNVVNQVKSFFLLFNTNNVVVTTDGHIIQKMMVVKYLGLYIDDGLSWSYHVDRVIIIYCQKIEILKRVLPNLSTFALPLYF